MTVNVKSNNSNNTLITSTDINTKIVRHWEHVSTTDKYIDFPEGMHYKKTVVLLETFYTKYKSFINTTYDLSLYNVIMSFTLDEINQTAKIRLKSMNDNVIAVRLLFIETTQD